MNTLLFKYAIEVERTRSITQAAENLFMAQPNLSKAIKEIEESLGFHIFERSSKGVVPTAKGVEFLVYARNIVSQLEKMEAMSKPNDDHVQSFNISIPRGSYIAHGFTKFIGALDETIGMNINVQETNSMQTITSVTENRFTLGIIRYQTVYEQYFHDFLADKQLCAEPLWEFEYLVLLSKNHALANEPTIEYDMLKQSIEIIHGDTVIPYLSAEGKSKQRQANAVQKKIYLYERCNQFELLSNIPTTFMWVSPIPEDYLNRYDLIQRRCKITGHKFRDVLIYAKGYQFTALDEKFIHHLNEAKKEVSRKEYY